MKIHATERVVERSNVQQETHFTIKATARSFEILSSGLYSDKILAVVRELSCNAYDAHVAAGKQDMPIEICLPTSLKPTFHVKDFGPGLSHEEVCTLYTSYFSSTKQDSNDYIGALGLGSKSPFSYTNSFMVESRHDGVKRLYTAFINEGGVPAIVLNDTAITDEPSGLTISLAVRRDDSEKFVDAAKKALMYFNPEPTIIGRTNFSRHYVKHTISGSNWRVRESDYYAHMNGPYVVQGFVAYPIDRELVKQHNLSNVAISMLNVDLDITVPMGDVEVAASREALSYDPRTIKNLAKALEVAASELRASFQVEFDKCTTQWAAQQLLDKYSTKSEPKFREVFRSLHRASPFMWNNEPVRDEAVLNLDNIQHTDLQVVSVTYKDKIKVHGRWDHSGYEKKFALHVSTNTAVIVDNVAKGSNDIIRKYIGDEPGVDRALVIRPVTTKTYSQAEVDSIIEMLGNPTVVLVEDMPQDGVKKSTYKKRDDATRLRWKGFRQDGGWSVRSFSRLTWDPVQIDLNAGGIYIPIERFSVVHKGQECKYFDIILRSAVSIELITNGEIQDIYGFSQKEMSKINPSWINLFDLLNERLQKMTADGGVTNRAAINQVFEDIGKGVTDNIVSRWNFLSDKFVNCPFKAMVEKLHTIGTQSPKIKVSDLKDFLTYSGNKDLLDTIQQRTNELSKEWNDTIAEYEMLPLTDWYRLGGNVTPIVNYVNMLAKV